MHREGTNKRPRWRSHHIKLQHQKLPETGHLGILLETFAKSGVYTIYEKVTDNAGNLNWQTLSISVILTGADTAKPSLKITSPLQVRVTGSLSDGAIMTIAGTALESGRGIQKVEVWTMSSSGSSAYKLAIPASADRSSWTHDHLHNQC